MLLANDGLSFWQELYVAFADIGIIPAILLLLGTIFIIIEIFQPGFGFFGISGVILVVVGIAIRLYRSERGSLALQFFVMILCVGLAIGIALLIMINSMRKGKLSRTAFVQKSTAVPEGLTKGTEDFTGLVGKGGITSTALHPSGNVVIAGKTYSVVAQDKFIEKDKVVEVIAVEGVRIVVKEVEDQKN